MALLARAARARLALFDGMSQRQRAGPQPSAAPPKLWTFADTEGRPEAKKGSCGSLIGVEEEG